MKQGTYTVLHNTALTADVFRLVLGGDTTAFTAPGQFLDLRLPGRFLRRPISVCDWDGDAVTVIYKRYNASVKRKNEERLKARRAKRGGDEEEPEPAHAEKEEEITFDEALGYRNDEEFAERAEADEMAGYDIKVRDRDPNKGIEYFEDEGSNIDDGTDYFDTYFKEQAEPRSGVQRFFAMIGFYIKNADRKSVG